MNKILMVAAALMLSACGGDTGVMREIERAEQEAAQSAQQTAASNEEFLEQVSSLDGVEQRASGLLLEFRNRGADQSLPRPSADAAVLVHYEGRLANGEVFDSSFARGEPAEFPLGAVVAGFSEAIQQMRPGDEVIATFPGDLGYGPEGRGPIPPNAALQFRIALLAFQEPGGAPVTAP